MRHINEIVIHCTATPPDMDIGVKDVRRMHKQRGFLREGYHFVNTRAGKTEDGRPVWMPGAHVRGHNEDTIGIALVGGVDHNGKAEANFTQAQYAELAWLLHQLREDFPHADILGHRDYSPDLNGDGKITSNEWMKECPCFDVQEWLRETTDINPIGTRPVAIRSSHRVSSGDTLWGIAKLHGVTVRKLKAVNEKASDVIVPNEVLVIPN